MRKYRCRKKHMTEGKELQQHGNKYGSMHRHASAENLSHGQQGASDTHTVQAMMVFAGNKSSKVIHTSPRDCDHIIIPYDYTHHFIKVSIFRI